MHLVDDVDLVAAGVGGKKHLVLDLPHVVDARVGGAVYLDNVEARAPGDLGAGGTLPAGGSRGPGSYNFV